MSNTTIDRSKTALVVIDFQKGIVGRQTAPHAPDVVVRNAAALAEACRKNGMPVFLVRVTPSPDGKDALRPIADMLMQLNPQRLTGQTLSRNWDQSRATSSSPNINGALSTGRSRLAIQEARHIHNGSVRHLDKYRRGEHRPIRLRIRVQPDFCGRRHVGLVGGEHTATVTKIFPLIGLVRKTE